jgi:hypothetical protein
MSEIKKEMEEALDDAFRNQGELKNALIYKLDENLRTLFSNEELNGKIMDLIENFESKSLLHELFIAAIRKNPTNEKLLNLSNKMDEICPLVSKKNLSQNFDELWSIIKTIKKDIVINECLKVLETFVSVQNEKSNLEKKLNEVRNIEKIFCFCLKYFFLVERENFNGETKTVLHLARNLANNEDVENPVKEKLNSWIANTKDTYNFQLSQAPSNVQPYLLIIISPENNSFRVYAYLMPDHNDPQSIEPIEYEQDEIALEAGIKCDSFEEIKNQVNFLTENSEKKLVSLEINKELIIEFFLPVQHLYEKVERWELLAWRDEKKILGKEYGVVVRSYDLFYNPKLRKQLRQLNSNRQKFNSICNNLECNTIQAVIHQINELKFSCDFEKLRFQLEREEKIVLKLNCPIPENEKTRTELSKFLIDSSFIMVIWEISNTSDLNPVPENDELLTVKSLTNLNNLFLDVKTKRREEHDIFLLCEEPHLDKKTMGLIPIFKFSR